MHKRGVVMIKDFSKMQFDIIIEAGQSNCEGRGFGDAITPYMPNEKIWQLTPNGIISMAKEEVCDNYVRGNFLLSFANKYVENNLLQKNRNILIVKTAVGGTGFSDKHWGETDDLFLRMLFMVKSALELGENNKLIACLWHQGERDSKDYSTEEKHFKNMSKLINITRTELKSENLPFIMGDFVPEWKKHYAYECKPIQLAMEKITEYFSNTALVSSDGLLSNNENTEFRNDTVHFCRQSLYILGERYFDAFMEMQTS